MLVEIVKSYPNAEGWVKGDIVDITNPEALIEQGLVKQAKKRILKKK